MKKIGIGIGIAILIAGSILFDTKAPCWLWKYEKVSHVPARCFSYFNKK